MLRILHTAGRRAPAVELIQLARARIGTAPGSEIAYAAGVDRGVMPQHAEIRREGELFYLIDLGGPSGTFVNRSRVGRAPLRSGDVVTLGGPGGPEFRVEIDPAMGDADGKVDLMTAQRMVQAAVMKATAEQDKTASIIETKVSAVRRRAARSNLLLTLGVLLALGGALIAAALVYRSQRAAEAVAGEFGYGDRPAPP